VSTAHPTKAGSLLRRFRRDEHGTALVLVTVMLPVLVGFSLLAIDMARVNNLHNDLQKAADAFALAAAAELDGQADAHDRADRALANLVANDSRFSDLGLHTLAFSSVDGESDIERHFLTGLPPNDYDPIDYDTYESDDPAETRLIEVRVNPTPFTSIFPASFLGGANAFNVAATAVAGFAGVVVCDMTPLFICNPFPEKDLREVVSKYDFYRSGIRLVPGDQWGPGNFGFLRPQSEHGYGENDLASDLARGHVRECVNTLGIFTQTGALTTKAKDAFNTRFDIYRQGSGFSNTDPSVAPAPNIRKGFTFSNQGNSPGTDPCKMEPAADTNRFRGMTRDLVHASGGTDLIGDGKWDYQGYLDTNNMPATMTDEEGVLYDQDNPPSRYDLYLHEIATPGLVGQPSVGGETGSPACSTQASSADRRLVYAAIVDCAQYADQLNGQSGTIQAMGYASFFLTEPVTGDDVYAEIVDIDGREGRGTMVDFARDNVQLYR